MTLILHLPPDTEAKLRERAAREGRPEEEIALNAVEQVLEAAEAATRGFTDEEFQALMGELEQIIDPSIPPLSEHALSRESFYEGR